MTIDSIESYPLHWPEGVKRRKTSERSAFKVPTMAQARDELLDELRRLGARRPIVSTNVPTRNDGLPRSGSREPDDPGVAVYFMLGGEPRVIACDRWDRVRDNCRAITRTIEALRGIERWGSSEMQERVFRGFKALPAGGDDWASVLGVERDAPLAVVQGAYRERAKLVHPDRPDGGNVHEMERLNIAWEAAKREKARNQLPEST